MEKIVLVRIDWKDREGQRYADSAHLAEIPRAVDEIRTKKGTLIGVQRLEER
jgi:hypothetical protein